MFVSVFVHHQHWTGNTVNGKLIKIKIGYSQQASAPRACAIVVVPHIWNLAPQQQQQKIEYEIKNTMMELKTRKMEKETTMKASKKENNTEKMTAAITTATTTTAARLRKKQVNANKLRNVPLVVKCICDAFFSFVHFYSYCCSSFSLVCVCVLCAYDSKHFRSRFFQSFFGRKTIKKILRLRS